MKDGAIVVNSFLPHDGGWFAEQHLVRLGGEPLQVQTRSAAKVQYRPRRQQAAELCLYLLPDDLISRVLVHGLIITIGRLVMIVTILPHYPGLVFFRSMQHTSSFIK